MTLQNEDIIDVITHDEQGRRNLRRVRVCNLRVFGGRYIIDGVNMQGGNPIRYQLPKSPVTDSIKREPNSVAWVPFDNTAEADE